MKNIIKFLSVIGVFVGFFITLNALGFLSNFLFLVHPVGDTLALISWGSWLTSLLVSILIVIMGISCSINSHSIYFQLAKSIKSSKKLIFLGFSLLTITTSLLLNSFSNPMVLENQNKALLILRAFFIGNPFFTPGIIILLIGLFSLKYNKSKFKEEIDTEEQKKFSKKLKRLSLIIVIIMLGFTAFNLYRNSTINNETNDVANSSENLEQINRVKNIRIITDISQARTVMSIIYDTDGNYDNFNYSNKDINTLCLDMVAKNPEEGAIPIVTISPERDSESACIYFLSNDQNNKDYWYCADSLGYAGYCSESKNDPSVTCRADKTSAYCPSSCK